MTGLAADMAMSCQGADWCSTPLEQVIWCPAWDLWLCHGCRWRRNERELRVTLEDRAAMLASAEADAETVVLLWRSGTRGWR